MQQLSGNLVEGSIIAAVIALIGWGFKRMITALLGQNKQLVTEALLNMKANTDAIGANTEATRALVTTLNQAIAVRDERDKTMFKQLDRIEAHTDPRRK